VQNDPKPMEAMAPMIIKKLGFCFFAAIFAAQAF